MEYVDWPSTIIKNDFLLSEVRSTNLKYAMNDQLNVEKSICNVAEVCLPTSLNNVPVNNNLYKNDLFKLISPLNDTIINDSFNQSTVSSEYFGSEGISPCSSSYYSSNSVSTSPELQHYQQQQFYSTDNTSNKSLMTLQTSDAFSNMKNNIRLNNSNNNNLNLLLNKNDSTIAQTTNTAFSTLSPPLPSLILGNQTTNSSSTSPSLSSALLQDSHYQYTSSLLQDSFFDNYNVINNTNLQNINENVENFNLLNDEALLRRVNNINTDMKHNNFTSNNHEVTLTELNQSENHQKQTQQTSNSLKIKCFQNNNFCDHEENENLISYDNDNCLETTVSSVCDSSTTEFCEDAEGLSNEALDEDFCLSNFDAISGQIKKHETLLKKKMILLPPAKTRSKMHDLAIKHRLITNQNTRAQSGVIQLSAEEKRTLLQEGYRLPTRLPLTREEEEALKIVRRKIKNKLSAQESRRKRKEYIDSLEKKIHSFYNENFELINRIKQLETINRDLLSQIKKFQKTEY